MAGNVPLNARTQQVGSEQGPDPSPSSGDAAAVMQPAGLTVPHVRGAALQASNCCIVYMPLSSVGCNTWVWYFVVLSRPLPPSLPAALPAALSPCWSSPPFWSLLPAGLPLPSGPSFLLVPLSVSLPFLSPSLPVSLPPCLPPCWSPISLLVSSCRSLSLLVSPCRYPLSLLSPSLPVSPLPSCLPPCRSPLSLLVSLFARLPPILSPLPVDLTSLLAVLPLHLLLSRSLLPPSLLLLLLLRLLCLPRWTTEGTEIKALSIEKSQLHLTPTSPPPPLPPPSPSGRLPSC